MADEKLAKNEPEDKKSKLINEEMEKMKHLLGYKKKTQ